MEWPDGRPLIVDEGILLEPSAEGRLILWLPGERGGGYQRWERVVAGIAGPAITSRQGIASVGAASIPIRQRLGFSPGRFLRRLAAPKADRAWVLPDGTPAEQAGARRTDLRIAWSQDATVPLDDARIQVLWPERQASRAIGPNLHLVSGIASRQPPPTRPAMPSESRADAPPAATPRALAEQSLAAARTSGDPGGIVTAMADVGLASLFGGDATGALEILAQARAEARRLGDPGLEADVASHLALAATSLGQPAQACDLLGPVLAYARQIGDPYAEKLALSRLAEALMALGDPAAAAGHLCRAVAIAADLGDRHHEADLLWRLAIAHAELGRRDRATAGAQAAVDRLRGLAHPTAAWYAHHLAQFQAGPIGTTLAPAITTTTMITADLGGPIDAPRTASPPFRPGPGKAAGPGLLRMAMTATKAMATFVGSGFKTASPETYRVRLATCASCADHTGVRCRLCGCLTASKARLLHERCPAGRWRA